MNRLLLVCASLFFCAPLAVSSPGALHQESEDEVKRLEEWPKPADKDLLKTDVERLRKARTEEMGEQAFASLCEMGACAAPPLLKALAKEKDEDALERIVGVLDEVTGAEHTRLLAREFGNKSMRVRVYALKRAALFPDHGLAKDLLDRLAKLKKKGDKADEDELYAVALATVSAGELAGLDVVFQRSLEKWSKVKGEIGVAVAEIRGEPATMVLENHVRNGKRKYKVAALRLLAHCGDRTKAVPFIKPLLDDTDNSLRVGAINALRGIVDGDPPLDRLPVFEAIELAKEWKARV